MASTHYYEKVKHLQDTRHESEKQRLELESRLNSYIKSDDRLAKLKAVRLRSYWKKICDDEERSRRRNEQLLREFDRVEAHMAVLAERTQRQRRIKEEYEAYVERMYPNWKQKVMAQSVGAYEAPQPAAPPFMQFSNTAAPLAGQPPQRVVVTIPQDPLTTGSALTRPFVSPAQSNTVQTPATTSTPRYGLQGRERDWPYSDYPQQGPMSPGEFLPQSLLLQQVPSIPPPGQWARQEDPAIPAPSAHQAPASLRSEPLYAASVSANAASHVNRSIDAPTTSDVPPGGSTAVVTEPSVVVLSMSNHPQGHRQEDSPTSDYDGSRSQGKALNYPMEEFVTVASPKMSPRRPPENEEPGADVMSQKSDTSVKLMSSATADSQLSSNRSKAKIRGLTKKHKTTDAESRDSGGADDYTTVLRAEHQSWASLASSDSERFSVRSPPRLDTVNESPRRNGTRSPEASNVEEEKERVIATHTSLASTSLRSMTQPQPDVTLDGFYNLLTAIQEDLPRTTSPEAYYRTLPAAASVKKEIIFNANRGAMLSHLDSKSISMVVKDQLVLLAANCDSGALLPDELFISSKKIETLTEHSVRTFVHPTCRPFWDKLYEHMVLLRRHDVMSASDIAQLFAELIISENLRYEEKAQRLLTSLLDIVEVIQSPGSTSTSFATPRQPGGGATCGDVVRVPADFMDDDDDEDHFFNQPLPQQQIGSLKDSVRYNQMRDEALKTHSLKSQSHDFEDDDDDEFGDFDDMLSPQGTGQQMTYNTTEGDNPSSTHDSRPTTPHSLGTTGGYLPSGLGSTGAYEYDPSGLESTGGYVPSGLDTGNSTGADQGSVSLGAGGKSTNRPAALRFGGSDEDDIEIPTRGGDIEEKDEDDEFEFYT